jgi:hypothetical protein
MWKLKNYNSHPVNNRCDWYFTSWLPAITIKATVIYDNVKSIFPSAQPKFEWQRGVGTKISRVVYLVEVENDFPWLDIEKSWVYNASNQTK